MTDVISDKNTSVTSKLDKKSQIESYLSHSKPCLFQRSDTSYRSNGVVCLRILQVILCVSVKC